MRALVGCGIAAWLLGAMLSSAAGEPLRLEVRPISQFNIAGAALPDRPLQFLGGLHISSDHDEFGGLSGIEVTGDKVFAISDSGSLVQGRLVHEAGRLVGFADAEIGPLFPDGETRKSVGDIEDVAFDPADPTRGVVVRERQANAMLTFRLGSDGPERFEPMRVGAEDRILRSNSGLESVAYAPPTSPVAGEVIAISERRRRGQTGIPGWVAGVGGFEITERDGFAISSARFLADGDLILLERRFSPAWGIALRLRRIPGERVAAGATLDGDYILDAGMTSPIDNMEGLAVSQDQAGRTILTLVSDDNHSILQRTLILQFALVDD